MGMDIKNRIRNAWNAFSNQNGYNSALGPSYSYQPNKNRFYSITNERTIINSVINKIAIDAASVIIKQVYVDKEGRYLKDCECSLNRIFNVEANIDQSSYNFILDVISSMLTEGCIAVVPIDGELRTTENGFVSISSMRVGKITEWHSDTIKVDLYNEETSKHEEVYVKKRLAAILENPFYSVMNAPNSTMKRLVNKLAMLDSLDEQTCSGKLNIIIQLPYSIKNEIRKKQAEQRRLEVEDQLVNSKYGIAYTDSTEKIIQLNRPLDNNLMSQIEYLTNMMYSHLGFTPEILNGTADESTMLNYYNRIVNPILDAVVSEFDRTYITETGRTQGQKICYFRDPFKTMSVADIAESSDKLTRNEIMSSNEVRQKIGMKPSDDPRADELINKNISNAGKSGSQENNSSDNIDTITDNKEEE